MEIGRINNNTPPQMHFEARKPQEMCEIDMHVDAKLTSALKELQKMQNLLMRFQAKLSSN